MKNTDLKYHFHPKKGWINDPNGLCSFRGEYHIFYQHAPNHEYPWAEPMVWGHCKTKDFLHFEELPIALTSDKEYDATGVWSGTATEYDGKIYIFYASVKGDKIQSISVAYSEDGIHFEKYAHNPVISEIPADGSGDFRDPAILMTENGNYLVIASADVKKGTGNLLLYRSDGVYDWKCVGVLREYENCRFCECPSFVKHGDGYLLSVSVAKKEGGHFFEVLYGDFDGKTFTPEIVSHFQKGPDEYAGQIFHTADGRNLLISWIPGWKYQPKEKCIGCLSLPLEITVKDGIMRAYPSEEVKYLVKTDGSIGTVTDAYIKETYVDGGREVHIELTEKP